MVSLQTTWYFAYLWMKLQARQPPVGQGFLIHEVSRLHSKMYHSRYNPLDECSARRKDLYLTTRNTHNRHPSNLRVFLFVWGVLILPTPKPRGLNGRSEAAHWLGMRVRIIPPEAWMSFPCERCALSGRGPVVGLIIRPEESYRMLCVWAWPWTLENKEALAH
jgi:hypothetical protein